MAFVRNDSSRVFASGLLWIGLTGIGLAQPGALAEVALHSPWAELPLPEAAAVRLEFARDA